MSFPITSLQPNGISSGNYNVVQSAYLAKAREVFPYINLVVENSPFLVEGTTDDLLAKVKDEGFAKRSKNKVRKCPVCSKAVAFTMFTCNSCGADLSKVEISYTNNVFVGFMYGIQKGPFPFTISIRFQSPDFLVFDDLLSLCPCHLNVIPTTKYLSDWRYLLKNPKEGKLLVEQLFNTTWSTITQQFLSNAEWKKKILKGSLSDDVLRGYVAAGFNYPPSQYQLHMQFMLPPFTPYHYQQYLNGIHFTPGRFFPVEYVQAILQLNIEYPIKEDTSVEEIIKFFDEKGVSYDKIHRQCYERYGASHLELANYDPHDFEGVILANKFYKFSEDMKNLQETNEDTKVIIEKDKNVLQNYGRPYIGGKPSGTYYKYAKKVENNDVLVW
jgi:hypothetical protein